MRAWDLDNSSPLLTAGFHASKITPPIGSGMAGYAARIRPSQGVYDDLQVRALTVSDGDHGVAMVSVDVLGLDSAFVQQARAAITEATGLFPQAVMIASTHTHGGPVTIPMFAVEGPAIDRKYMDKLLAAVVDTVVIAWNSRFPARIGAGGARVSGVGGNRHQLNGANDPELGLLKVADISGKVRAVCLNYACHPTVLGPDNLRFTADFPGFAVRAVAAHLGEGSMAMFLNGAAGNISVGRSPEATALGLSRPGRTFEEAARIGEVLAKAAIAALPSIETSEQCGVDFAAQTVELPLRLVPSPKEAEAAMVRARELIEQRKAAGAPTVEVQKAQLSALYAGLTHFESCRRKAGEQQASFEIQCLRVGEASFLAIPVEPFVEIGLELKRAAAGRLFVVELANGYLGYLPASGASEAGGYETVSARFMAGSDRIVVQHALQLERRLFKRDSSSELIKSRTH